MSHKLLLVVIISAGLLVALQYSFQNQKTTRLVSSTCNCSWAITSSTNVELLVTSPSGKKTGYLQTSNKYVNELPDASYGIENPDVLYFGQNNPENGTYTLQVIGKQSGMYDLQISIAYGPMKGKSIPINGTMVSDQADEYTIRLPDGLVKKNPAANPADSFAVPELPKGIAWTEVNQNQQLSNPALYARKMNTSVLTSIKLKGKEWYSPAFGVDGNYGNWLAQNGWGTEVPSFSFGNYLFNTISASGPSGSTIGHFKIVKDKVRIVNISTINDFMPGNKEHTSIFISDIVSKDELIQLASQ